MGKKDISPDNDSTIRRNLTSQQKGFSSLSQWIAARNYEYELIKHEKEISIDKKRTLSMREDKINFYELHRIFQLTQDFIESNDKILNELHYNHNYIKDYNTSNGLLSNKNQDIINKAKFITEKIEQLKQKIGFEKNDSNSLIEETFKKHISLLEQRKNQSSWEEDLLVKAKSIYKDITKLFSIDNNAKRILETSEKRAVLATDLKTNLQIEIKQLKEICQQIEEFLREGNNKENKEIANLLGKKRASSISESVSINYNEKIPESLLEITNTTIKPFKNAERYLKAMIEPEVIEDILNYYNSVLTEKKYEQLEYISYFAKTIIKHSDNLKKVMRINSTLSLEVTKHKINNMLENLDLPGTSNDQSSTEVFNAAKEISKKVCQILDYGESARKILSLLTKFSPN